MQKVLKLENVQKFRKVLHHRQNIKSSLAKSFECKFEAKSYPPFFVCEAEAATSTTFIWGIKKEYLGHISS